MYQFQEGSPLKHSRREHSCGILYDVTDQENSHGKIIVTGGRSTGGKNNKLFSTEYLDLSSYTNGWEKGPDLPIGAKKVPMLEDQSTGSVYLVGVKKQKDFLVYRLDDVSSTWYSIDTQPKIRREGHVALFLPTKLLTNCTITVL